MTEQELEIILYRIFFGKCYFKYRKKSYCLRSPTIREKYRSLLIYQKVLNSEKYDDWLRESGVVNFLIFTECWKKTTPASIKQIEKEIERGKIALYKNRHNATLKSNAQKNLSGLRKRLDRIMSYKYSAQANTIEYYANTIKNQYLISKCLTSNKKPVFLFNYKHKPKIYDALTNKCSEVSPSIDQIKQIARSDIWRQYWGVGKTGVFGKTTQQLTDDQRTLINFTAMYDNIAEHPEAPEDFVLEDDDMLDGWILYQKEKDNKDKLNRDADSRHGNASEVFVMAKNQQDLDTIHSMNDDISKNIINQRMKEIKSKKTVSDYDLPDIKNQIEQDIMSRR